MKPLPPSKPPLNVVFAVPYAMDSTVRFVRAAASLPGVTLGILSQEPLEKLPADLAQRVDAHQRVGDLLDADEMERGVRALARGWGGSVDRLIGILEQLQEPLAEVRERLGIRGMDRATARKFRDKAHMKDTLRAADLPCARHALLESPDQASAGAEHVGFPLVVKPPAGAGARGTHRVEELDELLSYVRSVRPSQANPLLLEEFVMGEEHSFDSVSIDGQHVFHSISRYRPTPLEVMQSPWIQWVVYLPKDVSGPEWSEIKAAGPRALDALGMVTGMTHMEWFRRTDGSIAISEVAARPPGAQFTSLLSYAHDRDFYRVWAEAVIFERFEPPERVYACGAAYLRGQGRGRVKTIHGLEEAQRSLGDLVVEAKLPGRGSPASGSYEGEGHVILRHEDSERVERGLAELVELIRVEMA